MKKSKKNKFIFKVSKISDKLFIRITFGNYKTMKKILNIF